MRPASGSQATLTSFLGEYSESTSQATRLRPPRFAA
jgi:hypothetical protein